MTFACNTERLSQSEPEHPSTETRSIANRCFAVRPSPRKYFSVRRREGPVQGSILSTAEGVEPASNKRGTRRSVQRHGVNMESGEASRAVRPKRPRAPAQAGLRNGSSIMDRGRSGGSLVTRGSRRADGTNRESSRADIYRSGVEAFASRNRFAAQRLEMEAEAQDDPLQETSFRVCEETGTRDGDSSPFGATARRCDNPTRRCLATLRT